jgi:hypothetical protein
MTVVTLVEGSVALKLCVCLANSEDSVEPDTSFVYSQCSHQNSSSSSKLRVIGKPAVMSGRRSKHCVSHPGTLSSTALSLASAAESHCCLSVARVTSCDIDRRSGVAVFMVPDSGALEDPYPSLYLEFGTNRARLLREEPLPAPPAMPMSDNVSRASWLRVISSAAITLHETIFVVSVWLGKKHESG